jgi:hypothetical protein
MLRIRRGGTAPRRASARLTVHRSAPAGSRLTIEILGARALRSDVPLGGKCGCRSGLNSVTAWRLHGRQRRSKRSCKNLEYAARQFQGREAFKVGFQTRVD